MSVPCSELHKSEHPAGNEHEKTFWGATMRKQTDRKTTFKISLEERPDFKGRISAFLFNIAGSLLEEVKGADGKTTFSSTEHELVHGRLFIASLPDQVEEWGEKPTIRMMERIGAYEPVIRRGGKFVEVIRIPGSIIDLWPICFCFVQGKVVKADSGFPICNARVHICEVDKIWRWIVRLPDLDVFRFRDDLLKIVDEPLLRKPPWPEPPSPFTAMRKGLIHLEKTYQTASGSLSVPISQVSVYSHSAEPGETTTAAAAVLSPDVRVALTSASAPVVRKALVDHVHLIIPYLCLLKPWWWRYRCDEIAVIETDALGRFRTAIVYSCTGDKPDLYFWVEYNLGGMPVTVYRPSIRCHTYWNYACGSEVTIRILDERVPACNTEPDLPGCVVQILSIGHGVSMSEIRGPGAAPVDGGLTTNNEPFGGKLEPRVWFSRTALRDDRGITNYRWSYRRCGNSDGTDILEGDRGSWTPLTRTVVRHYAVPVPGGVAHVPLVLGPHTVGSEAHLFEIRPLAVPAGGIEWTVVDEREDLASAHFETDTLGTGDTTCAKALDAAGKYELKLELFTDTGALVDWTAEGIDLQVTNVAAPFGTDPVTAVSASDYHRILNGAGHTVAFRMVLRVDNNCCQATVEPVEGAGLDVTPCGFIEYAPGANATLKFKAYHPNSFADFDFSVVRGVSADILEASAAGRAGSSPIATKDPTPLHPHLPHAYILAAGGDYQETFAVSCLLGSCSRAPFSEALHVWTRATDGYGRLWYLDAFDHDSFALTPPP